jgi:predicted dehydrogenase
VLVTTPDLWHALIGIDAVRAGKGVCLQKSVPLTIAEGRALSNAVHASGSILQIGSPQRSTAQFRYPAELVRNGRIGDVQRVEVGLPGDPPGGEKTPMPAPDGSNYEMWLGETPYVDYTLDRVLPHAGYDRRVGCVVGSLARG